MKRLLVTGGGSGLGAAIAAAAQREGYRVYVLDRDAASAQEVANDLSDAHPLVADVTDATQIAAVFDEVGPVDVLVNNAGILRTGPLIDHDPADFRAVLDVNLTSAFIVSQAWARHAPNQGGSIINIASINGRHPSPNCGAYAAAKGGLMALTEHMAIEWGELGIRVNAVAPGFVDAGMSSPFYENERIRASRAAAVPMGRLGVADDIANAVLFLASEKAAYISGETLTVDGGVINSVLKQLPRE